MMCRYYQYVLFFLLLTSCGKLGLYSQSKGEEVATVASFSLYEQDIQDYFNSHPFISDSDSIVLRNAFIDNWVKEHVLQNAAYEHLNQTSSMSVKEIDERVQQYRKQLIMYEFENSFIKSNLDTIVSYQSVLDYYNNNISLYKLSGPIIKCAIAKIPAGVRQSTKLENLFVSKNKDDVSEFTEICLKNNYPVTDFSLNWVDLSEVIKIIPISPQKADQVFSKRKFYSIEDDSWRYMIRIDSYLPQGSLIPVELEVSNIKKILLHERSLLLRSQFEDSILNSAYSLGLIKVL